MTTRDDSRGRRPRAWLRERSWVSVPCAAAAQRRSVGSAMRAGPVIVLGFLTAALGGCATFAPLPQTPAPPAKRVSLRVSASGESYLEAPPGSWVTWGSGDADLAVKALEESGWFARVGPLIDHYDYRAQIVVREHQGYIYGGGLGLLTAFVVPTKRMDGVEVEAVVVSASGAESRCSTHQDYAVWHQLFLLPVHPFRAPAWHKLRLVEQLTLRCIASAISEPPDSRHYHACRLAGSLPARGPCGLPVARHRDDGRSRG